MSPNLLYPILCFLSLVLLTIIGFGPSLYLISRHQSHRVSKALLISPAVALAEIGLITYPLFLNSVPLDQIAIPLTFGLIGSSIILFIADFRKRRNEYTVLVRKSNGKYVLGFAFIFFLLVLPSYVGGDQYRYWQGNTYDAANYWSLTYLVQHVPFGEIYNSETLQDFIQISPALIMPLTSPPVRLVVELPFGWLSLLFNVPVYEFYYYFKLLMLLITFFGTLVVAKQLNLPPLYRFGLIIALIVGFWPWFVSDSDALSQLSSIPLGMLFLFAWLQLEEDAPLRLYSRQRFLFSLSLAALLGYYPEFVPLTALALIAYYLKSLIAGPTSINIKRITGLVATGGMTLLLVLPTLGKMLLDLTSQSSFATTDISNNWSTGFYSWLYAPEIFTQRLWGLYYYWSENVIILLGLTLLGIILVLVMTSGILKGLFGRYMSAQAGIVTFLLAAFWGGALIIYFLGRSWVAAKAFAIGYPFALTALFLYAHQIASNSHMRSVVRYGVAASLVILSATQLFVPLVRTLNFAANQSFPDYVPVRSNISDILPVIDYLHENPPELLVSYFLWRPRTIAVGWSMMLSDQFPHYTMGGLTRYYDEPPVNYWQHIDKAPSHLLFDQPENFLSEYDLGMPIPFENTVFRLYRVTPEELNESVFRSNILDYDYDHGLATASSTLMHDEFGSYRVTATGQEQIRFIAGTQEEVSISLAIATSGKSLASIRFNDSILYEELQIQPYKMQFLLSCTTMQPGSNDLIIDYADMDNPNASILRIYKFEVKPTDQSCGD